MKPASLPVLCERLDSILRRMIVLGDSEIDSNDIRDLVLVNFVSKKIMGGYFINENGLKYLQENPYYKIKTVPKSLEEALEAFEDDIRTKQDNSLSS